ncbi:uncharacterized protein LOC116775412 isoform X3 [Danaus plexippus]|uniref:uncharacterized protein LOC116775412 isoform X3 n=1 Tax=Danaus plexippus TaxID=13037 RepID=UPI002AAF35A3|nr:uncharacterized protein LOC116775412 isoform X3 [Danaus plexippus]
MCSCVLQLGLSVISGRRLCKAPEDLILSGQGEAYCKWCQVTLHAQKHDLKVHCSRRIHQNKATSLTNGKQEKLIDTGLHYSMSDEDSNSSSRSSEGWSNTSKKPKSKFDECFEIIHASQIALCKLCQHKKVEIKMKNRNTSGLRKHLISCHKKESLIFLPEKPNVGGDIKSFLKTAGKSAQFNVLSGCDRSVTRNTEPRIRMANGSAKDKEREFLIGCIELYRDLPALWQTKSKLYHDRDKKNTAYDILLAKYNEMFPRATKEDLKKKINSLRTNYRKELKKHVNSMKSGAGADSVYEPTLWYFKEMNFLRDQELPLDSESSVDIYRSTPADEEEDNQQQRSGSNKTSTSDKHRSRELPENNKKNGYNEDQQAQNVRVRVFRQYQHEPVSPPPRSAARHLAPSSEDHQARDEHYYWVMACAADLRNMDRTQQIYAKKAIAEILMEGQLGALSRESHFHVPGKLMMNWPPH